MSTADDGTQRPPRAQHWRRLRMSHGLSQRAFGALMGVSRGWIGRMETEGVSPGRETGERCAAHLGMTLDDFYGGPEFVPAAKPDNLPTFDPATAPGEPEATADAGSDGSRQHDGSAALGKPSLTGDAGRGVGSLAESLDPMAAVMKLIDIADRSSRASERLADTVYALVQEKGAAAPRGRAGAGGGSPRAKPEGSPQKRAGGRR